MNNVINVNEAIAKHVDDKEKRKAAIAESLATGLPAKYTVGHFIYTVEVKRD